MSLAECRHVHQILSLTEKIENLISQVTQVRRKAGKIGIINVEKPLEDALIQLVKSYTGFNAIYINPIDRLWLRNWVEEKIESIRLKNKEKGAV